MRSASKLPQALTLAEEYFRANNYVLAKSILSECLKTAPTNSRANELIAYIVGNEGDIRQAIEYLDRACKDPNCSPGALYELGSLYLQDNHPELAIPYLKKALQQVGDFFEGLHDLGIALARTGNLTEAAKSLEKAINVKSDSAELFYNTARIYDDLKLPTRALELYKKSICIDPKFAMAWVNQGILFHDQKDYQRSLASYDEALKLEPMFADAWLNKGFCLHSLMRLDEAISCYEKAIAIEPNLAEAHFNMGLTLLLRGELERGFKEFEWRWKCKEFAHQNRRFPQPQWTGNFNLNGKSILLHNEQGLGDAIQFCRYIKSLKSLGANIILEIEEPLYKLFLNFESISELIIKGSILPSYDCHAPLMSLPLAFKTEVSSIPSPPSYLAADPLQKQYWENRIGVKKRMRVGIVWSSFSSHKRDKDRSILLSTFMKGFPIDQFDLICLQQKIKPEDEAVFLSRGDIQFFGSDLKNLSDTAALIECLDLVISVDTSVAHLSGALGKETWTLISYCPDWRWLANTNESLWYPSMKLFRQSKDEDWNIVLQDVFLALNYYSLLQ